MANKHILDGLIKWAMRGHWAERFEQVLEDHLMPACEETGLEVDEVAAVIGEDLFMSTVWACAFEDFLTREFEGGGNAIDDYLKRRGWKESASIRTYLAALRNSTISPESPEGMSRVSPGERDVMELDQPGRAGRGIACRRAIADRRDLAGRWCARARRCGAEKQGPGAQRQLPAAFRTWSRAVVRDTWPTRRPTLSQGRNG
jgi:hypothetical protein